MGNLPDLALIDHPQDGVVHRIAMEKPLLSHHRLDRVARATAHANAALCVIVEAAIGVNCGEIRQDRNTRCKIDMDLLKG